MGDRTDLSVVLPEDRLLPSLPSKSSNPSPSSIGTERWARAEKAAQNIICKVQPTVVSEERRKEVVDYVQRLIKGCLGFEVFPYGSVPLKTYLPDGDIDLTAFGGVSFEDALANDMVSVLEGEEQNTESEFIVKDVQLIRAEVKLVKCIVQNIVVDVSFNQIGGLCTLCFLEKVDRLIGKDHLFKRSIILIKAWCYYESRILGAHHGLISTYALETLVLYIFHLFHSTLDGPLAVLYKFLDYFSKFDWDNYCISLTGPVRISSLPEIVAETPESDGGDLLIGDDFLKYCVDMFSVPSKSVDIYSRTFPQKHLNIVDPLKENNNLGRSVSKGNFFRIRSAFTYGARKLGRILLQPEDSIGDQLLKFFSNTLDRHGSGQRPDVQDSVPFPSYNGCHPITPVLEMNSCQKELSSPNGIDKDGDCDVNSEDLLLDVKLPAVEVKLDRTQSGDKSGFVEAGSPIREDNDFENDVGGDVNSLATFRIQTLEISDNTFGSSHNCSESKPALSIPHRAPHLYFSHSVNGNMSPVSKLDPDHGKTLIGCDHDESQLACSDGVPSYRKLEDISSVQHSISSEHARELISDWMSANPKNLNSLSDLSGDYDSHFSYLQYGRSCFDYAATSPTFQMSSSPLSRCQGQKPWDAIHHSTQFKQNGYPHLPRNGVIHANGFIPNPAFYHVNPLGIPAAAFSLEEMPKPRGTGTYFPRTRPPQGYRQSTVKGRSHGTAKSPRNNGWGVPFTEANIHERSNREQSHSQFQYHTIQLNKPSSSDNHHSFSPGRKGQNYVNGFLPHDIVEFGLVGHISLQTPVVENVGQSKAAAISPTKVSSQGHLTLVGHKSKPVLGIDRDRITVQSAYHLKDDDDFPPLSV